MYKENNYSWQQDVKDYYLTINEFEKIKKGKLSLTVLEPQDYTHAAVLNKNSGTLDDNDLDYFYECDDSYVGTGSGCDFWLVVKSGLLSTLKNLINKKPNKYISNKYQLDVDNDSYKYQPYQSKSKINKYKVDKPYQYKPYISKPKIKKYEVIIRPYKYQPKMLPYKYKPKYRSSKSNLYD